MANALVLKFAEVSGALLIERAGSYNGFFKFTFIKYSIFLQTKAYRYSPSYSNFIDKTETEARREISTDMLRVFHDTLERCDYMLDDSLKPSLDESLLEHFKAGICNQREGFASSESRLSYFLIGIPGIGKSSFVQAFSSSLKSAITEKLDPKFEVHVVKIPLNTMSVHTLNHILCIQCISDWSVERMVEQALSKGQSVILHLEECPENEQLQNSFYACIERMLKKLFFRYPELQSNVIIIFTSNYEPNGQYLKDSLTKIYKLHAPTDKQIQTWLKVKLEKKIEKKIDITWFPPYTFKDVRPLNSFWLSVSHQLLKLPSNHDDSAFLMPDKREGYSIVTGWKKSGSKIRLVSDDGFFYYPTSDCFSNLSPKLLQILHMSVEGFLTPSVLVLIGTENWQNQTEEEILKEINKLSKGECVQTDVELLSIEDENKVLGNSEEVRGGLLKFIDDATNINSTFYDRSKVEKLTTLICIVKARINEIGQLLLRELLESGDKSRTHRLGVSKKGLIFILRIVPNSELTPQVESRATDIIFEA